VIKRGKKAVTIPARVSNSISSPRGFFLIRWDEKPVYIFFVVPMGGGIRAINLCFSRIRGACFVQNAFLPKHGLSRSFKR